MKIAVTGGIGSGKSTVSKILASFLRCELLDTDHLCRQQLQPGGEGLEKLKAIFGHKFLTDDGTLNRQALRESTFQDHAVRSQLETILHPIVRQIVEKSGNESEVQGGHLVVEVPLLYEVQWQDDFDECVVVYVPEHLVYGRIVLRDGLGVEHIRSILRAQMPVEEKREYTSFVIDNSGTLTSSVLQIANIGTMFAEDSR